MVRVVRRVALDVASHEGFALGHVCFFLPSFSSDALLSPNGHVEECAGRCAIDDSRASILVSFSWPRR